MPITVGQFRQFLSDSASSQVDDVSGRILDRVMQSTLRRLSREGDWTWARKRMLLNAEQRKQSTNATLTALSTLVQLDSAEPGAFPMLRRYFTEHWNIQLAGRETCYRFAEPPTDPNQIRLSSAYGGETTPVTVPATFETLTLSRSRYETPERFKEIFGVELPQEGVNALKYLSRGNFEIYRRGLKTSASQPWVYTTYGNSEIEFWPPAAQDRGFDVEIDFQAELRIPRADAEDTEELDWPDYYEDMLWAVGRLQLVVELGADAVQFDVGLVQQEYLRMLAELKSNDQSRGKKVWVMGRADSAGGTPRPFGLNLRGPVRGEG